MCVPKLLSSVHEMDCLGKETVSVSGRSGAGPDGNSSKRECAGCERSRVVLPTLWGCFS